MGLLKKLIRKLIPQGLVHILEKIYRKGRGFLWQTRYGFPTRHVKVIAVTGTNGKTTTCAYINEVLKASGYSTAVLTTVFYEVDGKREPNKTHFTIDKQSIAQKFFSRAKKSGVDWVVLEVTSHAIDQDRIMGVKAEIVVITNLTQEHLDYHGTMENYAAVKARLLSDYGARYAVLNADNEWFDFFRRRSAAKVMSFGKSKGSDLIIQKIKLSSGGSSAVYSSEAGKTNIKTALQGEFNLYNAAAAACIGRILNIELPIISKGISALKQVDGRMEPVEAGQDFGVYIDFAYTPDAIKEALKSLQSTTRGKVRIVFGATGDRDKQKRQPMGQVAAKYADMIYLTDDETYTEDPEAIRQVVYAGIKKAKAVKKTKVITDRKEAITQAIKDSKKGDAVLIAGLGHEDSRNMGGELLPWSDKGVAEKILKNL